MRRRTLRIVAVVAPLVSVAVVVATVVADDPRMASWAVLAAYTGVAAILQIAVGSEDLRIFLLAHAAATPFAAYAASETSVPGVVAGSAVAATVVLSLMDRGPSTIVVGIAMFGSYGAAMLVGTSDGASIAGVIALIGGGVVSWTVLTALISDLREGEGSYRHLFDRVPVGLYRTALSGELLDVNHALGELLGFSRDELIGMNARDLLYDAEDLDRLRAELGGGVGPLTTDLRFRRSDGRVIWVRDRTRAVHDEHDGVVCFEGELQDVTEERRHLETLEALVRSKSELIGAVSHELRTPLTAVVGFLDVLADSMSFTDGEEAEILSMAVEQAHEVAGIVEDLLTAARIDNRELLIHPEEFDLSEAVDAAVRSLGAVGIDEVTVQMPDGLGVHADAGRVRQILRNLITNAARHGEPPIRVEADRVEDGSVMLVVADHGSAIDEDVADRIFDAFFSGASASRQPGSIGLGLSVSRRLARLMGGELAHRRVGDETQFVLRLKATRTAARVA